MNEYRVKLNAFDAPSVIDLDMEAPSLASLVVKIMTICSQLKEVTGCDYEVQEIILTC